MKKVGMSVYGVPLSRSRNKRKFSRYPSVPKIFFFWPVPGFYRLQHVTHTQGSLHFSSQKPSVPQKSKSWNWLVELRDLSRTGGYVLTWVALVWKWRVDLMGVWKWGEPVFMLSRSITVLEKSESFLMFFFVLRLLIAFSSSEYSNFINNLPLFYK